MTNPPNSIDYLQDILENITELEEFTSGVEFDTFVEEKMRSYATIRALEIIGEAVKHIPSDLRDKHPAIPWRAISRMRDKLIHHYFGIDLEVVWKTVQEDIAPLKHAVEQLLTEEISRSSKR